MQNLYSVIAVYYFMISSVMAQRINPSLIAEKKWNDDQGNFINAHGAGILRYEDKFYLFGEIKKGDTHLVPGQDWEDYRVPAGGGGCYSFKEIVDWENKSIALSSSTTNPV